MMRRLLFIMVFVVLSATMVSAEIDVSHIVMLNRSQQEMLKQIVNTQPQARKLWHMLQDEANLILSLSPQPMSTLKYSGYTRDNDDRIDTEMALYDMDCLGILYYSIICSDGDKEYIGKAKEFILAWASTYIPTGNPENEDRLEPLFHCYFLIQRYFNLQEQEMVEDWMITIAEMEKKNNNLPMDKIEAQRIKTLGTLGYLLNEPELVKHSIAAFKRYIEVSLYPDGTSYELVQTNILANHVTMLEALVSFGITFRQFEGPETRLDVYSYQSPNGSSVKRSVEYIEPYAKGKLLYKEDRENVQMNETTMSYSLGETDDTETWFNPESANTLLQLSAYFDNNESKLIQTKSSQKAYETWLGLMVDIAADDNNSRLSLK